MNKLLIFFSCILFVSVSNYLFAQEQTNSSFYTTITFNNSKDQLQIIPIVQNKSGSDAVLKYDFKVVKNGHSGGSTSSQSGNVNIKANSDVQASSVTVDFSQDNKYDVDLMIKKDNKIIAEIHKTYSGKEIQNHEY